MSLARRYKPSLKNRLLGAAYHWQVSAAGYAIAAYCKPTTEDEIKQARLVLDKAEAS